jgi:hypothetical protein
VSGALAHAGHWLASIAAVVPVVLIGGWILVVTLRDRRRRGKPEA